MTCPLCGRHRARRGCPAVGQQICAICCGTKRLVEIRCPSDCPYLATAREHPPAAAVRQQQRDVALLLQSMRDLSEQQSRLFVRIGSFLRQYEPQQLETLSDDDVAEAAGALAATFETAARGLIYEQRPAGLPADRLATALKRVIAEAAGRAGSSFDRDAAVVLRRVEAAAREVGATQPSNRRAYLGLLDRMLSEGGDAAADAGTDQSAGGRLIVP